MAYNKDTDYQALINAAVAAGDYRAAAEYEQTRNEKINDLNARGENKWGVDVTNNYSSYLSPPSGFTGSSNAVGVNTLGQTSIRDQMNQNSLQWWTADDATKKALEAQNKQLASTLGDGVTYDPATGYWSGTADNFVVPSAPVAPEQDTRIDDLLNQILNRDAFSYDAELDPVYQQYREIYNREGNRSMNDTLAAAATNAGGMNSYAITAANQANDYYAAQLGDKIPELRQLAYQMYLDDIDMQVRDLGLLQQMDETQYSRYRDTMGDWRNDRDFSYGQYRDIIGDAQWDKTFDYNAGRDQVSDSRYESETAYNRAMDNLANGIMPDASILAQAGISQADADAWIKLYNEANKPKATGGGTPKATYGSDVVSVAALLGISEKEAAALKEIGAVQWTDALAELGIGGSPAVEEELPIDIGSVVDLGRGMIGEEELIRLEDAEEIESYTEDGKRKFRNTNKSNGGTLYSSLSSILNPFPSYIDPLPKYISGQLR